MKQLDILLVGIGGYGTKYVATLLGAGKRPDYNYRVVGAVDRSPERCIHLSLFEEAEIPIYSTIDEFYANHKADFAIISTPIFLHREHIEACVSNGSHVLCEKPLCTSIADVVALRRLSEESGLNIWIGYQLSFSPGIKNLKADILSGVFGKPISFRTFVSYPRGSKYYKRNQWAGKLAAADGRLTLDSPLHNAVAHHLNNMLFLLGDSPDRAANLKTVQAETYRANPNIESFDTVALRSKTESGVDVYFYTSHAFKIGENIGPYNIFRFENAVIFHDDNAIHEQFFAVMNDGRVRRYDPFNGEFESMDIQMNKTWHCMDAIRGGNPVLSTVEAAIPEVLTVNAVHLCRGIKQIEDKYIERYGDPDNLATRVEGLEDGLLRCFDECKLLSELDLPWAEPALEVEVAKVFDEGFSPF